MKMLTGLMKASRLSRKRKPFQAALALQQAMLAPFETPAKPKPTRKRTTTPRPATVLPPASAALKRQPPGSFVDGEFACALGRLAYRLYTPRGAGRRMLPLVVMLHGCTQHAADFARGTDMNAVADEEGFLVLYPEQSRNANFGRCWNWHRPGDQERGRGEPAVIAALTRRIIKTSNGDPSRVYVAGLSAGGAAAAIVGAAYPDLFVAVGVHSGLARGAVTTMAAAVRAMRDGSGDRPADAKRVTLPPMILFHGDGDRTVHPRNAEGFLAELERTSRRPLTARTDHGVSDNGRSVTRTIHRADTGEVRLESWIVHGSGHGWSGGAPVGSFTDPAGPDASREMARFFLAHRRKVA